MKTVLHIYKKILITLFLMIGIAISTDCFAQGDIYPSSQTSFTGAASVCENATSPELSFGFSTQNCGLAPFSPIDITVTWFSNTVNTTTGGTQVWQEISTTSTTSFNYTAPTNTAGTLYYYVEVSWGSGFNCASSGTLTSNEAQEVMVNAYLPASVSIVASASNICAGAPVTFTATPTNGGAVPSYQWQVNGVNAGTNNAVFTSNSLANNDIVTVIMTSDVTACTTGSPATSNGIQMTVNPVLPVSVNIAASATTICAGTSVTFTATPTNGGGSPSYQWKINGINAGTNNPVFTTSALANGDIVTVVMTSGIATCTTGNPATSNPVVMTVNAIQPVSVSISASATTICAGTSVTFTATPTNGGSSPSYQWKVDGVNAGTNSPTFTTSTLANGNVVTVVMTSNIASCTTGNPATSNPIAMTVNANQPASVSISASATTICAGTSVTFTATPVNGGSSPSYQWKVNGVNAGTNSPTFTTSTLANGNIVTVVMTSNLTCATGSPATSSGITMTVNPGPPAVTITPASATICQNVIQSLTASSGGSTTVSTGAISVSIPDNNAVGATNTLVVSGIPVGAVVNSMSVTINITHGTDNDLIINIKAPNGNILNLVDQDGGNGNNFANTVVSSTGLALVNTGFAPFTGTFLPDAAIGVGATANVSNVGAFSSLYSTPNGNWVFSVRDMAAPDQGAITSWSITLNWSYPITWSPITDLYSDAGATVPYTAGQILPTVYAKPSGGNVTYTATATAANGCTNSGSVLLTINPTPTALATPSAQNVCTGSPITQINITNPNSVPGTTFTWTRTTPAGLAGIANSGSGSSISGTFTNSTTAAITTTFTITATAGGCSSTTTATVTVNPIPTVSATNTTQTKCSGTALTNIIVTNPNGIVGTTFSWTRDNLVNVGGMAASGTGSPIAGTLINNTNVTQIVTFTIFASLGSCSSSTTATITVTPTPSASASPASQSICTGSAITQILITNPNAVPGTTFTWARDNTVNITGIAASGSGTSITGTLTNITATSQTTTFTITATSGGCSSTTTATVTVNPIPTVNVIANASYCNNANGAAVNFGSNVAGSTFAWTSTANVGFGVSGTGNIPAFIAVNGPVTATISVTATASGCTGPVRTFTITINPLPSVTVTADYCVVPGKVRLTANPLPAGTYTYLWSTGAVTQVIDVDIAGSYTVTVTNSNGCKATNSVSVATELAVNGNFEAGNTGFTTGYLYDASANGLQPEGRYAVNNNPNFNHTNFWGTDHTTGTGKMMIINGLVGPTVWQETVPVVPNTTYYFSAWALSMNNIPPFAQLQFSVNGVPIGVSAVLVSGVNNNASNTNWQRFYGTWSSGALSTATCSIVDLQGALGGNDFGLDDISISTLSPAAFYVFPSVLGGGTSICQGSTLNLSSNLAGGSSPYTFSWTGPAGFTSNLQNPSIPNVGAANSGTYSVTATDFYGCIVSGSRAITVTAPPVAASPVTATPATICLGNSSNLNGTTPSGTQSDFAGFFATSNWTTTNNPALTGGSINISGAPTYISITSGNNGTTGNTDYTVTNGSVAGNFTFNWSYVTTDIASNDIPQYSVNGGAAVNLPGFSTGGGAAQSGTATIPVPANQTFAFRMRTVTGASGAATTTFSNFSAPRAGSISWYTVASAGTSIGNSGSAANFPVTPGSTGVSNYYAEAISPFGCVSTSRTQVSVTVNTVPSFSLCPSNVVTTITSGTCSKIITYSATATGSASPTLTYTFSGATTGSGAGTGSGAAFNRGVTTVTITANTGCAPNANCSFTITVNDNEAPVFTSCPSNAIRNTAAGVCTYTGIGAEFNSTATDNCSVSSKTAVLSGATTASGLSTLTGQVFNKGVTTVTWTATDGTNPVTCTFTVTVNDNQAPTFSACPSNAIRNTAAGVCTYTGIGAEFNSTATDNCSVTSKTAVLTGATTGSGLSSLTGQVFNKGVTTVTWTASDGISTNTCVFTVTVNDNQAPSFSACPSNATRTTAAGLCTYTSAGTEFNSTATDNCSVTSKTAVLTGVTTGSGLTTLTGQVFNKGVTTVTWTASDGTNNTNCVFTVTVNDNQAPVFSTCPSNVSRDADLGVCTYTSAGNEFNSTATDNCSVSSKTAVLSGATTASGLATLTGQVFNKGVTTVTWTASDGTNNTTCVFTVTVIDNQAPSISCQSDIVTCSTTPSLGSPLATDNCAGLTVSNNAPGVFPPGLTTVTWTATDASGNSTICTQNVTVNPPAPAIPGIITGSVTVCEETAGFIYNISAVTNATTYTWSVPTGWTITAGTGTTSITVTSGSAGQSGNITVTAGNSCGTSSVRTLAVTITSKGTWLGNNTNWNDASNWCGGIPTSSTNVSIPFIAAGIYPVVSSATATAHDIAIAAAASLTVNGYTLQVAGAITNSGGIFDLTNGAIELNGSGTAQNISGSMFTNKTIKDLKISNSSGVNISGVNDSLKLSGVLKFGVSNAILNTNNNLTLLSSATGTASVGDMTNNGSNSGNNITGNVTVERFIPNHFKAWQLLAVPTTGQTVNAAWQEGNAPLSNSNNPGYGTIITSNVPGAVALGFDVYTPAGPTMKTYDSASNGWTGIPTPGMQIANKKGYMLFVRGDRSVTVFNQAPTSTILRTTGKLYTIGVDAPPVTNLDAGTFESIGNPYASAIDFNTVTKTGGVQDLFYVWDPKLTTSMYSAWGLGAYQTFIGPGPNYTIVPGGGSYAGNNVKIESGQAFFVHAPFATGSVSFTESCKVDGSNLVTRPINGHVKQLRNNMYVMVNGNPVLLDGTLSQFDADYSNAIDEMDAVKLANTSENLALFRDGKKLVAERRSEIERTDTIFYNLGLLKVQQYQFEFIASELDEPGLSAFLEDSYLQTSTVINLGDTTRVVFNVVNIPGSYAADRFRIVFQKLVPTPVNITSIAANRNSDKSIAVNWKVENETNIQLYTIERSEDGHNFNGIITADPIANNGGRATYTKNDISPLMKDNFYRIKALSFGGQLQYSAIVKVAPVKLAAGITVYPNPVIGKTVQLQFVDQLKGKYAVTLLYSNGQQQQLPGIEAGAGTGTYSVALPQLLASGVYRLRITGPGNSSILKTIHVSTGQ